MVGNLLDGKHYKVVLKKQFDDMLQADDLRIVQMLQDGYKADLTTHVRNSNRSMRFIYQIRRAYKKKTEIRNRVVFVHLSKEKLRKDVKQFNL